jgi:hypothetical protein
MKTLTLRDISWSAENGSLGRQVAASEQLTALLPQAEVAELLTKMTASRETLTAAKKIRPAEVDLFGKLDPLFEKGEAVDPVALIAETAEAQTQRDHVTRTVSALEWITMQYQSQLERLVNQSVDGLFDQLDTQLQDLLDEAEATFRALDGVTTADEAFARGKVSEWPAWIAQHARYQEIRRSHLVALQATDPGTGNFRPDGRAVGFAYFAALDDVLPRYIAGAAVGTHANPSPTYAGFTVTGLPWDPNKPGDLAHWTATVSQRGRLIPVVDPADEGLDRMRAAYERMTAETGDGQPAPVARAATDWSSSMPSVAGIEFRPKPDPRR